MSPLIWRIIAAVAIAVLVGLLLTGLVGPVLIDLKVDIAVTVGKFFREWGFVLGVVAGLLYFAGGGGWPFGKPAA